MFGMGIGEILVIIIIAILFLGPDKLPTTMVEIAKFFRSVKGSVNSARATLEEEMKLSDIKESALNYKKELTDASAELERMVNVTEIGGEIGGIKNDLNLDLPPPMPPAPKEPEVITFVPKNKSGNTAATEGDA
ncbi:MAG TPA: Sec-independent protein translocase protein TatB [Sulfuricurvum sp.]|nr:Sec-independent protein translocase protein TatB [Sulfuricurvum sp.]